MHDKYLELCNFVFAQVEAETKEIALEDGLDFSALSLKGIDQVALDAQMEWPAEHHEEREIGWTWAGALQQYRQNHRARIELAIWNGDELCGLMLGKASDGRLVVKVNYLQGSTLPGHPLKGWVAVISTRCAEVFANSIGAGWVAIQEPLDALIDYYSSLGYSEGDPFDPRNNALFKRLDDGMDL